MCHIITSYADECMSNDIVIDWRRTITQCRMQCPIGQTYQICGNSCTRSCSDLSERPDCKTRCVEGCNCPEGETLNDNGHCVPISQCGCTFQDTKFPANFKMIQGNQYWWGLLSHIPCKNIANREPIYVQF